MPSRLLSRETLFPSAMDVRGPEIISFIFIREIFESGASDFENRNLSIRRHPCLPHEKQSGKNNLLITK